MTAKEKLLADLIVEGDMVVTMDTTRPIIKTAAVVISGNEIVAVDTTDRIASSYRTRERLSGNSKIVMPGLINGHTHAAMTLMRGIADDRTLDDWLYKYIFPLESEFVDEQYVRVGTELACWEMIRGGITTFVDMYYFTNVAAEVVMSCGMRASLSAAVIDQSISTKQTVEESLESARELIGTWGGRNERINFLLGPHAIYTLNRQQLMATSQLAKELDIGIHTHLAESQFEQEYAQSTYGATPTEVFDSVGFLDVPLIAAHVVWPNETDIALLAENNVGVIHNPTSNCKVACGIAPIRNLLNAEVAVGLGTDGSASNNALDLWEEMRLASYLQKVTTMDPEALPAQKVLEMATNQGAKAIGLDQQIGVIRPGMKADIIQIDIREAHQLPLYDVISNLVYTTHPQDVTSVIVNGQVLMRDRQMLTIGTEALRTEIESIRGRIGQKLASSDSQGS